MGLYSVSVSLGSFVSGRLGGFYEAMTPAAFWTLHAAVVGGGGVLILTFGMAFRRRLFAPQAATSPAPQ
jgi:POT family proton-dependent oligopeptide transporter